MNARPTRLEPVATIGAPAGRADELHGERLDRAHPGGEPERDSGSGLDLAGPAYHGLGDTADQRQGAGLLSDRRSERLRRAEKVGGGEHHRECGGQAPQQRLGLAYGSAPRLSWVRGEHKGCSRLHKAQITCAPVLPSEQRISTTTGGDGLRGRLYQRVLSNRRLFTEVTDVIGCARCQGYAAENLVVQGREDALADDQDLADIDIHV